MGPLAAKAAFRPFPAQDAPLTQVAAPQESSSGLAKRWEQAYDARTGYYYYFCEATQVGERI